MERVQRERESPLAFLMVIENLCNHVEPHMSDDQSILYFKRGVGVNWVQKVYMQPFDTLADQKVIIK